MHECIKKAQQQGHSRIRWALTRARIEFFLRWSGVSNNYIDEPLGNMRKEKRERIYNFACILGESESKYS